MFKYDAYSSWGVSIRNIRVEKRRRRYVRIPSGNLRMRRLRASKKIKKSATQFRTLGSVCQLKPNGKGCEFLVDTGTDINYIPR